MEVQKRASLDEKSVQAVARGDVEVPQRKRGKRRSKNGDLVVTTLHIAGRPDLPVDKAVAKAAWETALKLAGGDPHRVKRHVDGAGYIISNA